MKRILLPTDFSENANNAVRHAVQMYGDEEVTFVFFHTFFTPHTSPDASKEVVDSEREESMQRFDQLINTLRSDYPSFVLSFEKIFKYGYFENTVREVIDSLDVDLIVMGTQGASGLEEVLIGSSTANVIRDVDCPVLAIPEKSSYKTPEKIVFPLEPNSQSLEASIQPILDIAGKHDAEVLVLYIVQDDTSYDDETIEQSLATVNHSYHTIEEENITEAIEEFVKDEQADFLAMITHDQKLFERLFQQSKTRKMVLHTNVPLLAMRNAEQ